MTPAPPKLWAWLTQEWVPLSASQAWVLWRALAKAQWTCAAEWRAQFLAFDAPDRVLSRDLVEAFFGEIASPRQLMDLLEALRREGTLLGRDACQIEEQLLGHVERQGQWKHQQQRKGVV
jgi:hypothetical protein